MAAASIKKVNLDQIQRPKTLIVIHYRVKRVSIPLFDSIDNITEYLWHQLQKFQTTVLEKQEKSKLPRNSYSIADIMSFTAFQQDKNKLDIKMNILLSMSRLAKDHGKSRIDLKYLDITNYYKYLQIEPYYGFNSKQLIPQYQLFSVLNCGVYYTVYLGRKISDGRFYSVKICRSDSKLSQNQFNCMKIIHQQQMQFQNKLQLQLIPQIQQVRKTEGLFIYIYEYCPGGNLKTALSKKLPQIECLHYMKQLIWGVHTLHNHFNMIHRALSLENIEIDFVGNLRLMNYAYCQPCFGSNLRLHSSVPQSYEQRYEIPFVVTPPQVKRSSRYNNLVDYFGIGVVLHQMFIEDNLQRYSTKKQKEGIQIAIQNFMAQNIRDRELFANQIISQLHEQKMKKFSNSSKRTEIQQHERLSFNKIYIGQSINIEQKTISGIKHEDALKLLKPSHDDQFYYLNPVKRSRKKSKNKSKSKSKQKSGQKIKSAISSKYKQSNSVATSEKSGGSKKKIIGSQKSLNKSIDSRNNSVKSGNSQQSKKKVKSKQKGVKQTEKGNSPVMRNLIPKSPTNLSTTIKSPPRSPFYQTNNYHQNQRKAVSPPKLVTNKSKNRL